MAMPKAAEMEVDECPVPKASYSLSKREGNPLNPSKQRIEANRSFLPVRILCP